jgi:hypothetical protein
MWLREYRKETDAAGQSYKHAGIRRENGLRAMRGHT